MTETIARDLASHCTELSLSDLDDDAVEYTKKILLDSIGTAIGGYSWSDSADVMVETTRSLRGNTDSSGATVLATGERFAPMDAALANGSLSHSLDYDNRHSKGSLHIGSSVVPAALAAAEVTGADGTTLLESIVAGYDVAARLGMACNPRSSHERGFHPTGTCGTFGATATAAIVHGLNVDQLVAAFGVNGSQASGGYQCSISGGWNKRIHPGLAARRAFIAIAYAENGFEGPPDPIEGELGFLEAYADRPRPRLATADLGEMYEVTQTKIKPYPIGTFAHVPIALLVEIVSENDLVPEQIEEVVVELPTSGAEMFGRDESDLHPTTSAEAQFDMPFAVALAVIHREAGLSAFDNTLADQYPGSFGRIMDATRTTGKEQLETYLPELYPARVTVRTSDGTFEQFQEWVRGEPSHPMRWAELEAKFSDLSPQFSADERTAIVDAVRTVETRTVSELVKTIRSAVE